MTPPKPPPLTETELTHRLAARYAEKAGNGNAYAFVPQVRNAAGFDAKRTIDAYVMALWPSRGLTLTAFEIKSSRSDWVRELHKPEKAETFCDLADFFYLVVGDAAIVHPGELPETWGLMVPNGRGLRVHKEAPALRDLTPQGGRGRRGTRALPPRFGRSFLAALLRSATYVGAATPEEIKAAVDRALADQREVTEIQVDRWRQKAERSEKLVRDFERAAHVRLGDDYYGGHKAEDVGKAVRTVLDGDVELDRLEQRIVNLRNQAQAIVDACNEASPA
jgi:hypothetical protein